MTDILDEVESDYRAEQMRAVAQRYAGAALLALLLVLAGVGLWQWRTARQNHDNQAAAAQYIVLAKQADDLVAGDTAGRLAAAQQMQSFAANAPAGYRTLALLRRAALLADAQRLPDAQAQWDQIIRDPASDKHLRQLASLLWVQRSLSTADPNALATRLLSITAADNPYHALGEEMHALLDIRLGKPDAARARLRPLVADPTVPDGVRNRASALLTELGG